MEEDPNGYAALLENKAESQKVYMPQQKSALINVSHTSLTYCSEHLTPRRSIAISYLSQSSI